MKWREIGPYFRELWQRPAGPMNWKNPIRVFAVAGWLVVQGFVLLGWAGFRVFQGFTLLGCARCCRRSAPQSLLQSPPFPLAPDRAGSVLAVKGSLRRFAPWTAPGRSERRAAYEGKGGVRECGTRLPSCSRRRLSSFSPWAVRPRITNPGPV